MKDTIYEKVKKYVIAHGMIMPGDCVVAGVSGGADSVFNQQEIAQHSSNSYRHQAKAQQTAAAQGALIVGGVE